MTIWLTGLSGAGKSTVALEILQILRSQGLGTYHLDGDDLRRGINRDLGFDRESRAENIRRVGEISALFADAGLIALVSVISPYSEGRRLARRIHDDRRLPFVEVFVDTPLHVCVARDAKGLYASARNGDTEGLTGIDEPYEPPSDAEVTLRPEDGTADDMAVKVLNWVNRQFNA